MSLAAQQSAFLAAILDEEADSDLPAAGLAVYRNNYRAQLMAAMEATYPRTAKWVGEAAFARAAAHHVITNPPTGWSLDMVGEGFAETLSDLFKDDGEVAELARTEWAMQCAFVAADSETLAAADFAAQVAGFDDAAWEAMRLSLHPSVAAFPIKHDLPDIWRRLNADAPFDNDARLLSDATHCVVYREGLRTTFITVSAEEGRALNIARDGMSFGVLCKALTETMAEQAAAEMAGGLLGQWLQRGWVIAIA